MSFKESIERGDGSDFVADLDKIETATLSQSAGGSKFGGPRGASSDFGLLDEGVAVLAAKPLAFAYMTSRALEGGSSNSLFGSPSQSRGSLHIHYDSHSKFGKASRRGVALVEPGYWDKAKDTKAAFKEDIVMRGNIAGMSLGRHHPKNLKSPHGGLHISLSKEQRNTLNSLDNLRRNPSGKRLANGLRNNDERSKNFAMSNLDKADVQQAIKMVAGVSPDMGPRK